MAARKLTNNGEPLYASFDVGNGEAKALSNVSRSVISFEPVVAPISKKRGTDAKDKPTYSLQLRGEDGKRGPVYVYGVEDVFTHGSRDQRRRMNSMERYADADYFNMLSVLMRHVFASYVGAGDYIKPDIALSIPISLYNQEDNRTADMIRSTLDGKFEIVDADGCELRIQINAAKMSILPESTGAMVHWAFDPKTLDRRTDTSGSTLVIDVGYETTDCSLFEGLKYQRDRAYSFEKTGMGVVTRAVTDYIKGHIRDADASRVDVAMRSVAAIKPGLPKVIEPTPGVYVDIAEVYDSGIADLAARIAQAVQSNYPEEVTRALLPGGGAYHLQRALTDQLPFTVVVPPDAATANVIGGLTGLKIKATR